MALYAIYTYITFFLLTMGYFVEHLVFGHPCEWVLLVIIAILYIFEFTYGKYLIFALLNIYMYKYYDVGNVWYK